ncbi:putative alpha-taxilin [Apostichopus japonicus]|uniref:Putative alpha-taxilin n=1 Tax=Stichopus japonicus TaxID=307972 RepID=A0A2G8K2I3_STIJA|nr:putative alpha-taxilin [Apostichopus japonicus]
METTKAADEDKLLLKSEPSEEEMTTSPEEMKGGIAVITESKQERLVKGTSLEKEKQGPDSVSMATDEVKEAVDELLQPTEEIALERKSDAPPDSPGTTDLKEVEISDGNITEEKLQQSAECTLPTPGEESTPAVTVSGEGGLSTSEESSEGKEKVVEKTEKRTKEEGKKEKQKDHAKKPRRGRDSEHMNRAISQALAGLNSPEEKIAALCKKYAELLGEHKSLQREHKAQQKQLVMLQRDRDQLQNEHGRAILAKSKLESLCRELQRHNKTIKEESLQRAKDEEEKRKEVSAKFQLTINEITTQMQDNHNRNIRLKEENLELASKLKKLVEQYERREEHIEKIFKHKELESQLYDAKLQQSNLALQEEQERCKRERTILAVYTEKFEEFQTTLTKSNEIFQTFKQEMDQMTKKIKKLEKETNMWRVRWENSNKSLLNMAEERALKEKELSAQKTKVMRLEKLCRALQAERNTLLGKARSKEGKEASPSKKQTIESVGSNSKSAHLSTSNDPPKEEDGTGTDPPKTSAKLSEPATVDNKVLVNGDCNHGDCSHAVDKNVGKSEKVDMESETDTNEEGEENVCSREGERTTMERDDAARRDEKGSGGSNAGSEVAGNCKEVITSEIERDEKTGEEKGKITTGDKSEGKGVAVVGESRRGEESASREDTGSGTTDQTREKCLDKLDPDGVMEEINGDNSLGGTSLEVTDGKSEVRDGESEVRGQEEVKPNDALNNSGSIEK